VRYGAYKFTVIVSIISALRNKIGNGATIIKQNVFNPRVATINYNSDAQIRKRTGILIVGDTITVIVNIIKRNLLPEIVKEVIRSPLPAK
jgi:hypothetical protein